MGWTIASEAEQAETGGIFDGVIWRWRLRDGTEREHAVYVGISAAALAAPPGTLPEATASAVASRGRTLVEEVLEREQPPRTIHVGRWSRRPSYSDEPAGVVDAG